MAKSAEATLLLRIKQTGKDLIDSTAAGLKSVGEIGAAAFAGITTFVVASIAAYKEQEQATNAVNRALIQQGIYSKGTADAYAEMATQLQRNSAYADENIAMSQAQLQASLGETKITKELMQATLDLAAAKKMDLASAAALVGKAVSGSTTILQRYGVHVSDSADKSERLANVITGLNRTFGGQAKAATLGLGAIDQLKNTLGDVLEVVGERFAPVFTKAAQGFNKFATDLQTNSNFLTGIVFIVQNLAKAGAVVYSVFQGVGAAIGQTLGTAVGAVAQIIDGQWKAAWQTIKDGAAGTAATVVAEQQNMVANLQAIDDAFAQDKEVKRQEELSLIQQNEEQKAAIRAEKAQAAHENFTARNEEEIAELMAQEKLKYNAQLAALNTAIAAEQNQTTKLQLELQKRKLLDDAYAAQKIQNMGFLKGMEETFNSDRVNSMDSTFQRLSQMQNSHSKAMVAIGKAGALAHIAIDTARGAIQAYTSLSSIPIVGPALGFAAAAAIVAYGAEQAGKVGSVAMADGGVVRATPGGTLATIGEGGRDEAVIPLEDGLPAGGMGGGTHYNLTVYGGLLGDAHQARELALALDKELLSLRRSRQSQSFDEDLT